MPRDRIKAGLPRSMRPFHLGDHALKTYISLIAMFCLILVAGCTAPHSNRVSADDSLGGSGSYGGSFLLGARAGIGFFTVLHVADHGRACEDADLTRVDDTSEPAKVDKLRVVFFFNRSTQLTDGVVFRQGEHGETVANLYCADLVPTWVRVSQSWKAASQHVGLWQEVDETANEPFSYDVSKSANEMTVVYHDGTRIRRRIFDINNGDLALREEPVATTICR